MESEATLNAGDVCLDCQQKGLEKYVRYFRINLNGDTLLKCESNECMYPYNDDLCSSDDDDKSICSDSQTNSLKLINDLIQQFDYEEEVQDTLSHVPIDDNVSEQVTQFDITFLDHLNTADNENMCKVEIIDKKNECFVNHLNDQVIESKCVPLPDNQTLEYGLSSKTENEDKSAQNFQLTFQNFTDESFKNSSAAYDMSSSDNITDSKKKINIQSVKTFKYESPLCDELPTSSNNITKSSTTQVLYTQLKEAAADQEKNFSKPLKVKQTTNKINKNKLKTQITTLNSTNPSSSSKLPTKITPAKSQSFNIPKADILKANAVLKNLATIEANEKFPKVNRKCKTERTSIEMFNKPELLSSSSNTDSNYSLDKIAKMLFAKHESKQQNI